MATKPAKIANKTKVIVKVVKEYTIKNEDGIFVARDVRTNRKVTVGATFERCRFLAGFRHNYAPAVPA